MKLFDRVSDEVRAALLQIETLSPSSVAWEDNEDSQCPITERLEAFFIGGRKLERGTTVIAHFSRSVDDGELMTSVSITHPAYEIWCNVDVWLKRLTGDYLQIAKMHYRTSSPNESTRTVMYVHDWIRVKAHSSFMKAKQHRDEKNRSIGKLRDKYKP